MFSLFSSFPLGLCIDGATVRLVRAGRRGGRIVVECSGEVAMPKGAIEQGVVRDPQKCAEVIRSLLSSLAPRDRRGAAVCCLPPEKVYTLRLRLPVGGGREVVLLQDLARSIPEEGKDLTFIARLLARTGEEREVGVAAVRTDVLQGYLAVLERVPLEVAAVTTAPVALAHLSHVARACRSFLLVLQGSGVPQTVTLFEFGWPCDEAVLGVDAAEAEVLATVKDMLREERAKARTVECLVVQVEPALRSKLQELCGEEGLSLREALSELGVVERKWVGAIAASLALERGSLPVDLSRRQAGKRHELFVLGALGIAFLIGALWYFLAA